MVRHSTSDGEPMADVALVAEADRLRDALLSKEEDVAGLKVVIEGYEDEKRSVSRVSVESISLNLSQWEDQLETLQATNATLQSSLHAAQEAARTLERRKAENQELQQTIKRLTHELDILRTQQSTGARHGREPTDASAGTGSVTLRDGTARMSLSDELRSHFAEAGEDSDEETTGGGKRQTVVRTVTYRTERVGFVRVARGLELIGGTLRSSVIATRGQPTTPRANRNLKRRSWRKSYGNTPTWASKLTLKRWKRRVPRSRRMNPTTALFLRIRPDQTSRLQRTPWPMHILRSRCRKKSTWNGIASWQSIMRE